MGLINKLFKSRDHPKIDNRTVGSSYSFYMGGTSAGKNVNERSAMQRCLPIRKHRGAREKRYSFGYAVFLILALMK